MNRIPTLKRGSALLVTLLIVGIVGFIGFGIARVTLLQARVRSLSDSAVLAYQAASAGLEFALAQYQLDKTVDIFSGSTGSTTNNLSVLAFGSTGPARNANPLIYNLSGGQSAATVASLAGKQGFGLLMYRHTYSLGVANCFTGNFGDYEVFDACDDNDADHKLVELQPDQSLTITYSSAAKPRLRAWQNQSYNPATQPCDNELMVDDPIEDRTCGALIVSAFEANGNYLGQQVYELGVAPQALVDITLIGGDDIALARQLELTYYGHESSNRLLLAFQARKQPPVPIGDELVPFEYGRTIIDVTGYAGTAQRRLRAEVDRSTGRIVDIFDYALYSGTGGITVFP